ncbi:MAG TPA: fibronectin type III domain-containing protein, partial [Agromyces sp.]|nr:fibronectin type III domain-containing protein [Agromyces sp.]
DHTDTTVDLSAGTHTISLAAQSLDGTKGTKGDAIVDKIDLSLANPDASGTYEAEYAELDGAQPSYDHDGASGSGAVALDEGDSATFWVYSQDDAPATLDVQTLGGGTASVAVNGVHVTDVAASAQVPVFLAGGVNKVVLTGLQGSALVDRVGVGSSSDVLATQRYEAEDGVLAGTAAVSPLSLASGGSAVTGVGGEPGNGNTLTFDDVEVAKDGTYALTFRYSNEEQSPASHYNPDPLARHADVTINGESTRVWFPHSFHRNNFWELSVPVELAAGSNTIVISSSELPNFDGETYISETFPDVLLRSKLAPNLDWISVTPFTATAPTAPDAPTAAKASSTSIAVQWAAPADDGGSALTGYRVYEVGGTAPVCEVASTVTDCTVEGLALASSHAFQVAAVSAVGEGPRSNASAVVTLPEVPDDDGAVTVPAKAELSASNGPKDGTFTIDMKLKKGENASLFKLYENGVLVATKWLTPSSPNPQNASVDISGLQNGVYQYVGVLVNSKGQTSTKPLKVTVSTGK